MARQSSKDQMGHGKQELKPEAGKKGGKMPKGGHGPSTREHDASGQGGKRKDKGGSD